MRLFSDVLGDLGRGRTLDSLSERLDVLAEAVCETGKAGSLTLKLAVKPNGDGSVEIVDEIKAVVPDASRGKTVFFTSERGLVRSDPRQSEMFREVREAPADEREVKEA